METDRGPLPPLYDWDFDARMAALEAMRASLGAHVGVGRLRLTALDDALYDGIKAYNAALARPGSVTP